MFSELDEEIELTKRHFLIFSLIRERGPIGIVKLSEATAFPKHKVRYSLQILQEEGVVEPTNQGAVPTEDAEGFARTRSERIDDLIDRLETLRSATPEPSVSP
ncbi:MAG TPA: hypothetical protein VJ898_10870 [Natrialbaceae archaeon]|nr:hypothetical protein [Natrialbaceae archaeon]